MVSSTARFMLYIFWFLHQTTTGSNFWRQGLALYIFWFLHQTTTVRPWRTPQTRCISFDSYIKPQLKAAAIGRSTGCISFDSYIKPQPSWTQTACFRVVYLLIPTSNHNLRPSILRLRLLYIFWFLHQTTTRLHQYWLGYRCISFDSYIKPQPGLNIKRSEGSCISFDSYIKPQLIWCGSHRFYCCISFDSYIKPQLFHSSSLLNSVVYLLIPTSNHNCVCSLLIKCKVVYLLIPTSNHNPFQPLTTRCWLYIFWFLHQTTTI